MKISALVARNKKTNEIIWAEGCDYDGYSTHQIIIPRDLFTDKEIESNNRFWSVFSDNINLGECEAKDLVGEYINISIKIEYFDIN